MAEAVAQAVAVVVEAGITMLRIRLTALAVLVVLVALLATMVPAEVLQLVLTMLLA
jgi:hypothetical protein